MVAMHVSSLPIELLDQVCSLLILRHSVVEEGVDHD